MLMSMNLTKLALEARRKAEAFYKNPVKNKNRNETIRILIISLRFFYLRLVFSQAHVSHSYYGSAKNSMEAAMNNEVM